MLGTACQGPLGGHQKVFFGRRIRHQLDDFRHAMNVAATNLAFDEPGLRRTARGDDRGVCPSGMREDFDD
jgi:hypothetical protein